MSRRKRNPRELTEKEKAWLATPEGQRQAERRARKTAFLHSVGLPASAVEAQAMAIQEYAEKHVVDIVCKRAGLPKPATNKDEEYMWEQIRIAVSTVHNELLMKGLLADPS
jgi:hypothetical protein